MSQEGPHMRDYEQKRETLRNEAPNTEAQHASLTQFFKKTKSHLSKPEKTNAILEHMPACFEWTAYLNEWESFRTLSQGHNQHTVVKIYV